jgi:flagellar basal body-associated protein FliL
MGMRIVIAVVVVLMLALGGAAGWFFLLRGGDEAPEKTAASEVPAEIDQLRFIKLDAFSIPVIRYGRVSKYILLQTTLEVVDPAARDRAQRLMPRLKDAFLMDLHGYFADRPAAKTGINTRTIKKRMKRVADRTLGPDVIIEVLVEGAVESKSP